MNRNMVIEIENIPYFVELYMKNNPEKETLTHAFCKFLLNNKPDKIVLSTGNDRIDLLYKSDDKIFLEFTEFYLDKSQLDHSLNCKYEIELDLPKSLTVECFYITIKDNFGNYRNRYYYIERVGEYIALREDSQK